MASGQPPGLLRLGILSLVYMPLGSLLMEYAKVGFDPTMGLVGSKNLKNRGIKGSKLNNVPADGFLFAFEKWHILNGQKFRKNEKNSEVPLV